MLAPPQRSSLRATKYSPGSLVVCKGGFSVRRLRMSTLRQIGLLRQRISNASVGECTLMVLMKIVFGVTCSVAAAWIDPPNVFGDILNFKRNDQFKLL